MGFLNTVFIIFERIWGGTPQFNVVFLKFYLSFMAWHIMWRVWSTYVSLNRW